MKRGLIGVNNHNDHVYFPMNVGDLDFEQLIHLLNHYFAFKNSLMLIGFLGCGYSPIAFESHHIWLALFFKLNVFISKSISQPFVRCFVETFSLFVSFILANKMFTLVTCLKTFLIGTN